MVTLIVIALTIAWLGRKSFQAPDENDFSRPSVGSDQASPETPTGTSLPTYFPIDSDDTAPAAPGEASDQSLLSAIEKCWSDRQLSDLSPHDQFTVLDLEKVFGRIEKQELLQQKEELLLNTGLRRTIELLPDPAATNQLKAQISDLDADGVPSVIAALPANRVQGSDFKKWRLASKTHRVEKKLGLLFDDSLFIGGAAGTATEVDGRISDFQVRADGKILKCAFFGADPGPGSGSASGNCECN